MTSMNRNGRKNVDGARSLINILLRATDLGATVNTIMEVAIQERAPGLAHDEPAREVAYRRLIRVLQALREEGQIIQDGRLIRLDHEAYEAGKTKAVERLLREATESDVGYYFRDLGHFRAAIDGYVDNVLEQQSSPKPEEVRKGINTLLDRRKR